MRRAAGAASVRDQPAFDDSDPVPGAEPRLGPVREGAGRPVFHAHRHLEGLRRLDVLLDLVAGKGTGARADHCRRSAAAAVADLIAQDTAHYGAADRAKPAALPLARDRADRLDLAAVLARACRRNP